MKKAGAKGESVPKNQKPKHDDVEQSKRFIETAKLLDAEENEIAFEGAMELVKYAPKSAQTTAQHRKKKNRG